MVALNKIAANSPSRQSPSELESSLANALFDLESNTQDLKASLRPLQFVSAREVGFSSQHELCFRLCVSIQCASGRVWKVASSRGRMLRVIVHTKNSIGLLSLSSEYGWHKLHTTTKKMRSERNFADAYCSIDRGRPWQEGYCHLRSRPSPPGLPQDPAAVRFAKTPTIDLKKAKTDSPQLDP